MLSHIFEVISSSLGWLVIVDADLVPFIIVIVLSLPADQHSACMWWSIKEPYLHSGTCWYYWYVLRIFYFFNIYIWGLGACAYACSLAHRDKDIIISVLHILYGPFSMWRMIWSMLQISNICKIMLVSTVALSLVTLV